MPIRITHPTEISGYRYTNAAFGSAHVYLLPEIERILTELAITPKRAFDLGCGNGCVSNWLNSRGYEVSGVDPSESAIAEARNAYPCLDLRIGSSDDPLQEAFGTFPLVISLEVVEHVYAPRTFSRCVADLLEPDGYALISTPYHGYLKNLALALTGKLDSHFTALWDHGHIKFWSPNTITTLLSESGLTVLQLRRIGRIPQLAKAMVVLVRKDA